MTQQVLEAWNFSSLDELREAVNNAVVMARAEGHRSSTVYTENAGRMTLVEETLTDGAKVLNLFVLPALENRLIEAAPELLEALKQAREAFIVAGSMALSDADLLVIIDAAIAKATA